MSPISERAAVAAIEPYLRAIGFLIWGFIGVSRLVSAGAGAPWLAPWLIYGVGFLASAWHARLPRALAIALLLLQTGAVLLLPTLGLPGFEGLLLSIVVAEAPMVFSIRDAALGALLQIPPLVLVVHATKTPLEILEILGAYSTFSAFALLAYRLYDQEHALRTELARTQSELLSTRALVVETSRRLERLALSRELHDSLGHQLTALILQLEVAQQQPGSGAVAKAEAVAREALGELRRLVSAERPGPLDLVASVKALAAGIPAPKVHVESAPPDIAIEGELAHHLFRAVQEAITNALRHAAASNVWVTISRQDGTLELRIKDDGRGARPVVRGFGLQSMEERLAAVGASLEISSQAGRGFEVVMRARP
jgi:signal transduction histidine kinase